jgi:hypothetical protein
MKFSTLALGCVFCLAAFPHIASSQTSSPQASSTQAPSTQVSAQTASPTSAAAPGQTVLVGCLIRGGNPGSDNARNDTASADNGYRLVDGLGRMYDLTGDNTLLAPYEGAKIEISGTFSNASPAEQSHGSSASRGLPSSTVAGTANTGTGISEQGHGSFNVAGVTKAADTCSMHN